MAAKIVVDVYFDMASSVVKGANVNKLRALAAKIAHLGSKITISVTGYAQPTKGSELTDSVLSHHRAAAVAKILRALGVNTKIIYAGAGRAQATVAASRYVEIVVDNK